jgi:hypothetical protein
MTKLIKAGLAVLAIALLTSSALAFSPVWEPLPDIIVGGGDAIFTDAINVNDYLSDEDNNTTELRVVFADGPWDTLASRADQETDGLSTSDVTINSKVEVDYAGKGDLLINNDLMGDAAKYLFTPGTTTLADLDLTIEAADGVDAAVVLIASDGATSAAVSKAFRVRGIATDPDEVTFPVGVIEIDEWSVDADFADWAFGAVGAPTSGSGSDTLSVTTTLAQTDLLGWWQLNTFSNPSLVIPVSAGQLMRARWNVALTFANATELSSIQMRVFAEDSTFISDATLASQGAPASGANTVFENFFTIPAGLTQGVNVGLFHIDGSGTQGGTSTLNSLELDEITGLDGLFSTEVTIDAAGDRDFTDIIDLGFAGTDMTASSTADAFTYNVTGQTGLGTFNIAQINSNVLTMAANTLYRVRNTVASSQAQAGVPAFRLRAFSANNARTAVVSLIGQTANSGQMPTAGGVDYDVYLASTTVDGQGLLIALDIINNQSKTGDVVWDSAVISSVDLGQIP